MPVINLRMDVRKMSTPTEIGELLRNIRSRYLNWHLSPRQKNLQTLSALGITSPIALKIIFDTLHWKDYVSGPQLDNHHPPLPGEIWIFGLTISHRQCYLKLQDQPTGIVIWISFHFAQYPLKFPYKN